MKSYPITIPHFEWTLEFALPTPVPAHQFHESPMWVEVKDRNPDPDNMIYKGPNVIGGYVHPVTGKIVSREEHVAFMDQVTKIRAQLIESQKKHHDSHHH